MTKKAIMKYMTEITGTKGIKQIRKLAEKVERMKKEEAKKSSGEKKSEEKIEEKKEVGGEGEEKGEGEEEEDTLEAVQQRLWKKWYILHRCIVHCKQGNFTFLLLLPFS